MNELSKCCGAWVRPMYYLKHWDKGQKVKYYECQKCHEPCEITEKNKPQDTALYAALRR